MKLKTTNRSLEIVGATVVGNLYVNRSWMENGVNPLPMLPGKAEELIRCYHLDDHPGAPALLKAMTEVPCPNS